MSTDCAIRIRRSFPFPCYIVHPRPKYLSQQAIVKYPQPTQIPFFSSVTVPEVTAELCLQTQMTLLLRMYCETALRLRCRELRDASSRKAPFALTLTDLPHNVNSTVYLLQLYTYFRLRQ